MDETMIAYSFANTRGTVVDPAIWVEINGHMLYDCVSKSATRTNMSWLASIASDPEIQRHLPQILKARKDKFPQYLRDVADLLLPDNVTIDLGESIWNDQKGFEEYVVRLHASLRPFAATRMFVLVVDASRTHISESIAARFFRLGILLVLLPGGLTWLLQPLDVYIFGPMKRALREKMHRARIGHPQGQLQKTEWLTIVMQEVGRLNQGDHAVLFARLGLDGIQNNMRLVDKLQVVTQEAVNSQPRQRPTREELAHSLGRVNVPFYDTLMRVYRTNLHIGVEASQASSSSAGPARR